MKLKSLLSKVKAQKTLSLLDTVNQPITEQKQEKLPKIREKRVLQMIRWGMNPKRLGTMLFLWLVVPTGIVVVGIAILRKWRQLSKSLEQEKIHLKRSNLMLHRKKEEEKEVELVI